MQTLANLFGVIGVLLLLVPILYVERYARLLHRLSKLKIEISSPAVRKRVAEIEHNLAEHKVKWHPFRSVCLIAGTLLCGLSYLLPLLQLLGAV